MLSEKSSKVLQVINLLSPNERIAIAEAILSNLDIIDSHIEEMWVREAEARLDAFHSGKEKALSLEEVFQEYFR